MEFTAFLEEKYRKFFRFLDVCKVGYLTSKTFKRIEENAQKTQHPDGAKGAGAKVDVLKWWQPLEALTDDGNLDEPRFIAVMKFIYSDPEEFEKFQLNCEAGFSLLFQSIKKAKLDSFTKNDLQICYRWFGVTDRKLADTVFVALDTDSDGLVSRKEYLEALHKYFFSNDTHAGCNFLFDQ